MDEQKTKVTLKSSEEIVKKRREAVREEAILRDKESRSRIAANYRYLADKLFKFTIM